LQTRNSLGCARAGVVVVGSRRDALLPSESKSDSLETLQNMAAVALKIGTQRVEGRESSRPRSSISGLRSRAGDKNPLWIDCQPGAREHYAVPRALLAACNPCQLHTEAWVRPGSPLGKLKRNLRERYHAELTDVPVHAWNARAITFELRAKFAGLH